jgi:hypothetical protein
MDWKHKLATLLVPGFFTKYDHYQIEVSHQRAENISLEIKLDAIAIQNLRLQSELEAETLRADTAELAGSNTPFEVYCAEAYKEIPKFAYKDKFWFEKIMIPVYPNEFITSHSYLIEKARAEIAPALIGKTPLTQYKALAKWVDQHIKWTSDMIMFGVEDRYTLPIVGLTLKKEDCELHAFVLASLNPNIGVAFGFAGKTGHAFNVTLIDDELYVIETNTVTDRGRSSKVFKYKGQNQYQIRWIFTQNHTYKVGNHNQHFGVIHT